MDLNDLTATERMVLIAALKCYQHASIGNVSAAMDPAIVSDFCKMDGITNIYDACESLQVRITGIPNGGPSITSSEVSDLARVARRLEDMVNGKDPDAGLYNRDGSVKYRW